MNELNTWLQALSCSMMRPLGITLIFPLLATNSLGTALIRNGIVLALILPIVPQLHTLLPPIIGINGWIGLLLQEMVIGTVIGFCAAIPFWAVDMAGFLIDTLRGATMSTIFNPAMGVQTSIFGLLFTQLLSALFLLNGGLNLLVSALYDSYHILPLGKPLSFNPSLLHFMLNEWQMLYRLCLSFALPAVLCMLFTDLALGLVNRAAQQLNVFFLAMPIKSVLALLLLLLSLPAALHYYLHQTDSLYLHFSQLLKGLAGNE